ncbi:hypothetical protein AB0M46_23220 [Dactylosporangium sp. NPDC051485]|uniref:hypothetical protein n=1 Tax=Dactylosporangium sp. NPDC051485 TaxID=3154846 RepID=UPI00343DAAC8
MGEPDAASGAAAEAAVPEALRGERLAARKRWRLEQTGLLAWELVVLQGRRWDRSRGASMSLLARIGATLAFEEAVFAVWDLVREDPPPDRERVYRLRGDFGPVAIAHTDDATLIARAGGPFLLMSDRVGERVWRIDGDEVWDEDLAEILREMVEVAEGRPAVDESQIPPMPVLPWHRPAQGGSGS